ncbi:cyclase family protein [Candidatus Microgenomates bacterium]|nr:cyclase family protein [Candidatus Microgenomates bacterium]
MSKIIDLSVSLNEDTPVYPGDPKTKIEPMGVFNKDGYEDSYVCIGTHVGTHIDAPRHMVKGGKSLDKITIDRFAGRGVYIKVSDKKFDLEQIKKADIQKGDIVLFHTGMSAIYYQTEYYNDYPAITEDIANFLIKKKVKMIGVDMCSPDYEPFPVHRILLKNDILIIENLTNLKELRGKEFRVYALPIKLQIDGAPARVVAELNE